jgi:hypothetical protein
MKACLKKKCVFVFFNQAKQILGLYAGENKYASKGTG